MQKRVILPDTPPTEFTPMGDALTLQARAAPEAPAVTLGERTWTRAELEAAAGRCALALEGLGVREGDLVTICAPTMPEHHVVTFAVWKLGATPAPVSHRLPLHELRGVVDVTQPRVVVGKSLPELPGHSVVELDDLLVRDVTGAPPSGRTAPYLKATTSGGSTGRPKVIVDHNPGMCPMSTPFLGVLNGDIMLHPAPLYHNAPFFQTNMAIAWGCHVIEVPRFDAREWLRLVETHRVTWAYLVPTMMHRIWSLPQEERDAADLSSLEFVIHMAAACPQWLREAWIGWLGPDKMWDLYAGTEAFGGTFISGPEMLAKPGSVGRPNPGNEIHIIGPDGERLPPGEVGEIRFAASSETPTYHYLGADSNNDGQTDSYGDMGWLDEDGYLFLADRRTDMIVVNGANVYPAEIEAALDQHPRIASSLVVGLPDDERGATVHAVIQPRNEAEPPLPGELRDFLAERLVTYKLPHTMELVGHPLRDDAGKARRTAIRDERIAQRNQGATFVSLR